MSNPKEVAEIVAHRLLSGDSGILFHQQPGMSIENAIFTCGAYLNRSGGKPDIFVVSPDVHQGLGSPKIFKNAYGELEVVVLDNFEKDIFFISTSSWIISDDTITCDAFDHNARLRLL